MDMYISIFSRNWLLYTLTKTGLVTLVLMWPENLPDMNPIENILDAVKSKMRGIRSNIKGDYKVTIEATDSVVPEAPHLQEGFLRIEKIHSTYPNA